MSNPFKDLFDSTSDFFAHQKQKAKSNIEYIRQKARVKKAKIKRFFHPTRPEPQNPCGNTKVSEEIKQEIVKESELPQLSESQQHEMKDLEDDDTLLCPISQELMTDPVMTPYGHCFQRSFIEEWVDLHGTCPLTSKPLEKSQLIPSFTVKAIVEQRIHSINKHN